jgi:pimeloyl-ACP methyl ester carboxylesterase
VSAPVRLQSHVWNPVGERRALLLHGLTSDGATWWRIASDLANDGFMVVAPDLRSHGRSPTAVDHRVATLAADVAQLGSGWDLLIGHSLGGSVAAVLAAQQHVAVTVLIDPVLDLPAEQREPLRTSILAELQADPARIRAANPTWDERDVQRKAQALQAMTPDIVDVVFEHNDPWDVRWAVPRWSGLVHLLAADPDHGALLSTQTIDEVVRAAGDRVSATVVDGAGHSIQRERPDLVLDAVRRLAGTTR